MARGQLKILKSFDELVGSRQVSFVVKNYASSRHTKIKSVKNCGIDYKLARKTVSEKNNKNLVITRELRRVKL